jgi:transcriptional regulator GlxA family with amidase domain
VVAERARYWRHAAVTGVGLLRERFLTHRYSQLRVRLAHRLLDAGMAPAAVAAAAGFADQAHLTRHFKRMVGVPPAAY